MRAEGHTSARSWLKNSYMGYKGVGSPWADLWSQAAQVDLAMGKCKADSEIIALLGTDDRLELALRHLGAHFYQQHTHYQAGAAHMRAVSAPRAQKDVVPSWLVNEATVYSKAECQCTKRVTVESRRRERTTQKGDGKGRGKGKKKDHGTKKDDCADTHRDAPSSTQNQELFNQILEAGQGKPLFHLRLPPKPLKPSSLGSRSRQRFTGKMSPWKITALYISSLNWLHSSKQSELLGKWSGRPSGPPSLCQLQAQVLAMQRCQRLCRERRILGLTGAQTASTLFKTTLPEIYSSPALKISQVPFIAQLIAEPPADSPTVNMLEALPPSERSLYMEEANVLSNELISNVILHELEEQYGFLGGDYAEWVSYLRRPDLPPSMWKFDEGAVARARVSAVKKKDGRLRKLVMACPANYLWADVRDRYNRGLGGAAALSRLTSWEPEVEASIMDESNAFTSVITPSWMWPYMGCPRVRAKDVWHLLDSDLQDNYILFLG